MIGYIAGLALFLLSGCDSFLTQLSENNTTVANHFRSEADVEAAVYGMHAQFREVMGSFTQDYRDRGLLLDNFGLARWREANEHNLFGLYGYSRGVQLDVRIQGRERGQSGDR